jgi:hypothetical protein
MMQPTYFIVPVEYIKELEEQRNNYISQMEYAVDKEALFNLAGKAYAITSVINKLKEYEKGEVE